MNATPRSPRLPQSPLSGSRANQTHMQQNGTSSMLSPSRPRQLAPKSNMTISGLPRYHPATYSSPSSSSISSPDLVNADGAPLSPHALSVRRSEAQRQLYLYQRELASFALGGAASNSGSRSSRPTSPRLHPVALSPGAVTPLELEQSEGYLLAPHGGRLDEATKEDILQRLIAAESGHISASDKSQDTAMTNS